MNSFLKNLQDREKKLLLGALILTFLFVIFIYINSLYDGYITSKKNLSKAKSDYEYVYKKVSSLKLSSDKYVINEANINLIITANDLAGLISDLSIDKTDQSPNIINRTLIPPKYSTVKPFSNIITFG